MEQFVLLANPFWVNLLIFVPILLFFYWRKNKLNISRKTLLFAVIFGIAFGVIEATCVIYLRAAIGLLPGYEGTIMDIWKNSNVIYNQQLAAEQLPISLLVIEIIREAGTIIMLGILAIMVSSKFKERFAIFLWVFAVWDIAYYAYLFLTVRWPRSLTTPDVLFLIPDPWTSQVWFPILISLLTIYAVFVNTSSKSKS